MSCFHTMQTGKSTHTKDLFRIQKPLNTDVSLTTFLSQPSVSHNIAMSAPAVLPTTLDWRDKTAHDDRKGHLLVGAIATPRDWSDRTLGPVLNQGTCGSCWAVSATSILTDYFRLFTDDSHVVLSPTPLLDPNFNWDTVKYGTAHNMRGISPAPEGCEGLASNVNNPGAAFLFGQQIGLPLLCSKDGQTDCVSYDFTNCCATEEECGRVVKKMYSSTKNPVGIDCDCSYNGRCKPVVRVGNAGRTYKLPSHMKVVGIARTADLTGADYLHRLKTAITKYGPILTASLLPGDFMSVVGEQAREGGIYVPRNRQPISGGHAMAVVGWGRTNAGQEYLIFRNSWGTDWGDKGFFRWDAQNYTNGVTLDGQSFMISFAYITHALEKTNLVQIGSADKRTNNVATISAVAAVAIMTMILVYILLAKRN